MIFTFVIVAALVTSVIAGGFVPFVLATGTPIATRVMSGISISLLWIAGILNGLMMLIILAAAAWGMDTSLPWGRGIYPFLIPALGLPAFLLLLITSVRTLSRVFWFLTAACAFAWYFGDKAGGISSAFFNSFTLLFVMIATLVQVASLCRRRADRQAETTVKSN